MLVLALVARPAGAEEGMWTFDSLPTARMEQSLGVKLDRAWLDHLRLASVRLSSGCSAALVSKEGLALTNQHCILDCVQALSSPGRDYLADGFLTEGKSEERLCPGLRAEVLVAITDATGPILAASQGKAGAAFVLAQQQAIARAERSLCGHDIRLRCQTISFFGGGQIKVYAFRRFDDVRLAFSPEFATAFFGGDADNFTFPRFDLDCAFLRLYDHGRPATTPSPLVWSRRPLSAGEAVFVSGNPGMTERGDTVAQLETARDELLPAAGRAREDARLALAAFAASSPENRRLAADRLFGEENALKVIRGRLAALADPAFMAARRAEEAALRAKVAANPTLAAETGDPWADIAATQKTRVGEEGAWRVLEYEAGGGSQLHAWARALVRAAAERTRPSVQRLPEFAEDRLSIIAKQVADRRPAPAALEAVLLSSWLTRARNELGADSAAVASLLGGEAPDALARRLASSRLGDPAVRKALWSGGAAAIQASDDPMIAFVLRADPLARAARGAYEDEVVGPAQRGLAAIARARFATGGEAVYPDATFSLRLSWGRIAGWDKGATKIEPFTTFAGLYGRAGDADPLPPRWLAARSSLELATVFDFVTTNDIAGGNSGSPVVDARGELVGAAFDGNEASIAGDFAYDGARNRTVAVSTAAIGEALAKVYRRTALLGELGAR
ncbi:MAG TPA: S46 family peptidase [Caulobacteraceae bacterium]|nr:S46 family peptidase [Caulobacteraceae bacterium]